MSEAKKTQLGRFELRKELGRGFHGRVFLAWDPQLEREVAIKWLLGARQSDDASRAQFMTEARAVARLAHPNIIPLYEVGMHGKIPFLVFEYVQGIPLKQEILQRERIPEAEAVGLFAQILDGMAVAHEQDVVHLDLSPNNLMFDRHGRVRIMDFGLARFVSRTGSDDGEERMHGTPRYMSPEHFSAGKLDQRTDVFALGLILFELLTGEAAAQGDGLTRVRSVILQGKFDWEGLRTRGVSPGLIQLLRDALAREPVARFQTAREFAQMLAATLASQTESARQDVAVQFLLRRLQRRPEFPAFSSNILEINRMTGEGSLTNLHELAEVIQRDFSLTNRLMKIANSAFFDRGGAGVTTVAQAIGMVGTRLIRLLCNGLLVFERLQNGQAELQDALVSCFVAGLMARNLGLLYRRELAEEAFICGLFNRLGRNLVMYYLPEEWSEIAGLVNNDVLPLQAERQVLGSTCATMGAAVARLWKFPAAIVESMAPVLSEPREPPLDDALQLRLIAQLANELCEAAYRPQAEPLADTEDLAFRYRNSMRLSPHALADLLNAALEKFLAVAPSLDVDAASSGFCQRALTFVAALREPQIAQRGLSGDLT